MATDVVERSQRIVRLSKNQHAFAGHVHVQTVTAGRQLLGAAHAKPLRVEEALALKCEDALAAVEACCESRLQLAGQNGLFVGIHCVSTCSA
jgi:hypothetical protein